MSKTSETDDQTALVCSAEPFPLGSVEPYEAVPSAFARELEIARDEARAENLDLRNALGPEQVALLADLHDTRAKLEEARADYQKRHIDASEYAVRAICAERERAQLEIELTEARAALAGGRAISSLLTDIEAEVLCDIAAAAARKPIETKLVEARAALRELARYRLPDGTSCWCGYANSHSPGCVLAKRVMEDK